MANQDKINELISESAFQQVEKLDKELVGLNETFIKCLLTVEKYNAAVGKSGGLKELIANQKKYEEHLLKTALAEEKILQAKLKTEAFIKKEAADFEARVQKQISLIEKRAAKSVKLTESERLAEIKLDQDRKKAFDRYEADVNKQNALDEKRAQVIANNSRPYTVLSNELEKQRKRAQDLAIVYGEQSKQFLEAAKGVISLDTRLKAVDATLGKSQRNVGNYKSGFNGLANSVNQMTRELPAFTFSVQTGFMALSNNIPIFFDQIQQTRAEISRLRAEGQKVPGLFKQLASSIFSFGTIMSVVITLFTVYGKEIGEFFGAMFKGTEAVDKFAESQKRLGEAFAATEVTKAVKSISELKINIDLAKQGLLDKDKVLKQYNESIGKTTGEVKSLEQAEKELGENADDYVKMTLYKAAAQLALDEAAKKSLEAEQQRIKKAEEFRTGFDQFSDATMSVGAGPGARVDLVKERKNAAKRNEDRKKVAIEEIESAANDQVDIARSFQEKAAKIANDPKNRWDFFDNDKTKGKKTTVSTSEFDAQKERVDRTKNAAKEILDDEQNSFEMRLQALDVFNNQAAELINIDFNRSVKKAKGNAEQIKFLEEKRLTDLQDAQINGRKLSFKLLTDQLNEEQKERLRVNQKELSEINESEAVKLDALNVAFANRTISEKQYGELRQNIQREYIQKYIEAEIKQVKDLLEVASLSTDQRAEYEKKLSDLKLKLSREVTKNQIEDNKEVTRSEEEEAKKRIEANKEAFELKKQIGQELFNFSKAIVSASFENELRAIQDEKDANEKRTASEIENVNNSIATEQEKADQIAIINARAAANSDLLDQKVREVKRRQAVADKAAAVTQAIINGALAMTKVAATTGPATFLFTPLIAAFTAAQIATIIATPIPEYFTGTDSSKGGPAWTDELGPELYIPRSGKPFIGSDKPNIKHLQPGTKIIPHHELVKMTAKPELYPELSKYTVDVSGVIAAQDKSATRIIKALGNQKSQSTIITKSGWRNTQSRMDRINKYLKNNFN